MKQAKISVIQSLLGQCRLLVGSTDPEVAAAAAEVQASLSAQLAKVMQEQEPKAA